MLQSPRCWLISVFFQPFSDVNWGCKTGRRKGMHAKWKLLREIPFCGPGSTPNIFHTRQIFIIWQRTQANPCLETQKWQERMWCLALSVAVMVPMANYSLQSAHPPSRTYIFFFHTPESYPVAHTGIILPWFGMDQGGRKWGRNWSCATAEFWMS